MVSHPSYPLRPRVHGGTRTQRLSHRTARYGAQGTSRTCNKSKEEEEEGYLRVRRAAGAHAREDGRRRGDHPVGRPRAVDHLQKRFTTFRTQSKAVAQLTLLVAISGPAPWQLRRCTAEDGQYLERPREARHEREAVRPPRGQEGAHVLEVELDRGAWSSGIRVSIDHFPKSCGPPEYRLRSIKRLKKKKTCERLLPHVEEDVLERGRHAVPGLPGGGRDGQHVHVAHLVHLSI